MTSTTPSTRTVQERARAVAVRYEGVRGSLIEVLHAVQAEFGWVPRSAVSEVADVLNLSVAEVHGVVSFYDDFRTEPQGRTTVRICRAEACQAVGAEALAVHAAARLRVSPGETTLDGAVTLEDVYCLGNCALGPAAQVGGRVHGRVAPARLDALLGDLR